VRGNVRLASLECRVTSQIFARTVIITSALYIKYLPKPISSWKSTVVASDVLAYKKVGKAIKIYFDREIDSTFSFNHVFFV